MANELLNVLNDINNDKKTNLLSRNLRKDVTCLGVNGTYDPLPLEDSLEMLESDTYRMLVSKYSKDGKDYLQISATNPKNRGLVKDGPIKLGAKEQTVANAIGLTPDKLLEGNTILGVTRNCKSRIRYI